jgi:hypothetical protein
MAKKKHKEMRMTIRWVPGHEGVPGNEEADRAAKQAIEEGSSPNKELPAPLRRGMPRGRTAMQRAIQEALNVRAGKVWRQSPRYGRMKGIDESMPSKKFAKLVAGMTRKKASLLIQLRSGHVPLTQNRTSGIARMPRVWCAEGDTTPLPHGMPKIHGTETTDGSRGGARHTGDGKITVEQHTGWTPVQLHREDETPREHIRTHGGGDVREGKTEGTRREGADHRSTTHPPHPKTGIRTAAHLLIYLL